MAKINLNKLAKNITLAEGKAKSLPIGQVKEVVRLVLEELGEKWCTGNEVGVIEAITMAFFKSHR